MNIFVNPSIKITEPKKNKNFGYYTTLDHDDLSVLKIKAYSHSGRKRGVVGIIDKQGQIITSDRVKRFLTSEIQKKIKLTTDLIFGSSTRQFLNNGLIQINRWK